MSIENEPLFGRLKDLSPFSERELVVLVATAPRRYKSHYIEKRNGRGKRLISQPTAEIKLLQRLLIRHELSKLPIHHAAVAYRQERSIKDHARAHVAGRYLLKLDFIDFFPSLHQTCICHRLAVDANYSEKELWILCQLLCRLEPRTKLLQLSIGAPSSPHMSNYLMWEFDTKLAYFCDLVNATYTRYADDLAISTCHPHTLDLVQGEVRRLLEELSYLGLRINEEKTVNVSKKNRRTLVGLTLSNDCAVSVGRQEKRRLRAMLDALCNGRLAQKDVDQLRGKLAFVHSIDPVFVQKLCEKYGFSCIASINLRTSE